MWVEVDSKAQNIRLNGFRLYQNRLSLRSNRVVHGFFMEIEVDQIVLPAQTDRNSQTLVGHGSPNGSRP